MLVTHKHTTDKHTKHHPTSKFCHFQRKQPAFSIIYLFIFFKLTVLNVLTIYRPTDGLDDSIINVTCVKL